MDLVGGLALGVFAHAVAFARDLSFLDQHDPWQGISFHLRNLRVLDVGCGLGTLWEAGRPSIASYTGLDLSATAVEERRRRFGSRRR